MTTNTQWSTFHGDNARTGMISGSNITADNVSTLQLVKSLNIGGPVLSVPAIYNGYIYVGTANGTVVNGAADANGGSFHKIDLTTGDIAESFYWQTPIGQRDTHGFLGMGCTPAIYEGRVYFSAFDGQLYCLDSDDLTLIWTTNFRTADLSKNQPVTHPIGNGVLAEGWSSPLVINGRVYVGIGEGENPDLYGFIYCVDAESGNVDWIFCTSKFASGTDNSVNQLPLSVIDPSILPSQYSIFDDVTTPALTKACVVWTALTYDPDLDRIFCVTGNPQPDSILPAPGYAYSFMSFEAATGNLVKATQIPGESSYRPSDLDIDFGASPAIFTDTSTGQKLICAGCKNGGFFVLDADSLEILKWRQILPFHTDGSQISTVDPHGEDSGTNPNPVISNEESNNYQAENFHGTYSTPSIDPQSGKIFIGSGGNNYHFVAAGIDSPTTPFMRAFDWETLDDAWPEEMVVSPADPTKFIMKYSNATPMYSFPGEAGLSSPAVVNDVVFCSTSKISLYAFSVADGTDLWSDQLGSQTQGFNGGYGYCLGPAVTGDYVVAGGLVLGMDGGILNIYSLPNPVSPPMDN